MKKKAPKSQTKPSTPRSAGESKTARPMKGRNMATPMTPFTAKAPMKKGAKAY